MDGASGATINLRLLLTPEEAACALGISRAKLYPMLMRKQIPSIRIGNSRRIPVAALEQYVRSELSCLNGFAEQRQLVRHPQED